MKKARLYMTLPIALSFLCFSEMSSATSCHGDRGIYGGCSTVKKEKNCNGQHEDPNFFASSNASHNCIWRDKACHAKNNTCVKK
jgi:hypothetical protein